MAWHGPNRGGTINVTTSGYNGEGIESKNYLNITGGTVSGGTEYFGGMANVGGTVSNGSTVTLSTYSGGNSGPGGH